MTDKLKDQARAFFGLRSLDIEYLIPFTIDEVVAFADQCIEKVLAQQQIESLTPKTCVCKAGAADAEARLAVLKTALNAMPLQIPTSWLDPLLTGPNKVLKGKNDCRDIEALLRAIQDRLRIVRDEALTKAGVVSCDDSLIC